jgi:hypothetical protein
MRPAVAIALNTTWMQRTGWSKNFASVDRKLLVQLVQIPRDTEKEPALGVYNSVPMQYYCETKYLMEVSDGRTESVFVRDVV